MKTKAAPKLPLELEEYLGDPQQVAKDMQSGEFVNKVGDYAASMVNDQAVAQQVSEQIQMVQANLAAQGITAKSPVNYSAPRDLANRVYNSSSTGAQLDGQFADFGEVIRTSVSANKSFHGAMSLAPKLQRMKEVTNAFSSEVPDAGGFLIPEEYRAGLLQVAIEQSYVRQRATVLPMNSLRLHVPTVDDTSHASSVFGGITAAWTEEGATIANSQASYAQVVLDAKKLVIGAQFPNELLADAPALNGWISSQLPKALAWHEDDAFFNGVGGDQPQGFINCNAAVSVAAESGQATKTIVWENIVKMFARQLPQSLGNSVWFANIDTFSELATMALSVGTGGGPVWIGSGYNPGNSGASVPPMTILGRPVIFTMDRNQTLGTTGDIVLADLSYYLIGDRQAMTIDTSTHYLFGNDKTALRIIERLDGRPWLNSAITPKYSSNALSPFVQLATR